MFSVRLLRATLAAAISLVLGISALVIIWFLFFALLGFLNPNWAGVSVSSPQLTAKEWLYCVQGILGTWAGLLAMAAPIWILAWLPLYLVRSRRAPWRISKTISVAALVGGVGGALECLLVFFHYVGPIGSMYHGAPPFVYAGTCFVIGSIGGAFIGAAEILTSKWFKGEERVRRWF
jgi:hypothetical protein